MMTQRSWQNLLIPKTSDGKKAVGGGTKMTYRYYLQDMAFAAAIQGSGVRAASYRRGTTKSGSDSYLGRKNWGAYRVYFSGY